MNKKIIAYLLSEHSKFFIPEPARKDRDWSGKIFSRLPERCIPLTIANQSGWVIRNPFDFTVIWDGGTSSSSLRVEFTKEPPFKYASSHFGYGILTIHIPIIFNTPDDIDLWVRGAPNEMKDGIHPLEGLVECDWLPFTFTMNWKCTRFPVELTFDEGFPICFICPHPRSYASTFETCVNPISANSQMEKSYFSYSGSRDALLKEGTPIPVEGVLPYQGFYIKGEAPCGTKAPTSHRILERLKKFKI